MDLANRLLSDPTIFSAVKILVLTITAAVTAVIGRSVITSTARQVYQARRRVADDRRRFDLQTVASLRQVTNLASTELVLDSRSGNQPKKGEVSVGTKLRFVKDADRCISPVDFSRSARVGDEFTVVRVDQDGDFWFTAPDGTGRNRYAHPEEVVFA